MIGEIINMIYDIFKEKKETRENIRVKNYSTRKNRPELKVKLIQEQIPYLPNLTNKGRDFEAFILPIEGVSIEKEDVIATYNMDMIERSNWVYFEYECKNVGKNPIYELYLISNDKKNTCIHKPQLITKRIIEIGYLNYYSMYDQRIGPDESIILRLYYHKSYIIGNSIYAIFDFGMRDDDYNYWQQPFFAPEDKVYESMFVTKKEFHSFKSSGSVIKRFKETLR